MIFFGVFVFATHFRSVVHCAVPPNRDTFGRGERQPNLLGADHGFRASQAGQCPFPVPRQQQPARYSRSPRRWAGVPKRSSNRTAYASKGAG
jgi:hypothetical protein